MGCYIALITLLFILHTVNGQTTTATPPSSSTDPLSSSTATSSSTTSPSDTTASSVGGSFNTTQYHFGNLTTAFPGINTTNPFPVVASFSRRCSSDPPLCCLGQNNSCFRGCFCDVACLRLRDCCSDFRTTCVTGVQNGTSLSATVYPVSNATNATNVTNATNATNLTNATISTNVTNSINATKSTSTSFPVFSLPGNCSAQPALCCKGSNINCFRGCFCDEYCKTLNDCCPDYADTCIKDIQSVIGSLKVSILAPSNSTDASLEVSIHSAALQLQAYLKATYSEISSFRIIKLKKT